MAAKGGVNMTDKVTITREDLYKFVWEESLGKIAKRYGISPTEITVACNKLDIPKPQQGHWTKIDLGHQILKPELPEPFYEDQTSWTFGLKNQTPVIRKQRTPRLKKTVFERLKEHPILKDIKKHLSVARYKTEQGYLKPNKKIMVDIFVTPECVDKASILANTLFLSFLKDGYEVYFSDYYHRPFSCPDYDILEDEEKERRFKDIWSPWKGTFVNIDGMAFGIKIFEMLTEEKAIYLDGDYIRLSEYTPAHQRKARYHHTWESVREYGSRRLCLMFYSYDKWIYRIKEVDCKSLDVQVPEIVGYLKDSVPELLSVKERLRLEREQREREWEEEQRLREIEREKALIEEAHQRSTAHIEEIIKDWGEAVRVHNFFNSIEHDIQKLDEPRRSQLVERTRLAKELVGTVDPLEFMAAWKTPNELYPVLKKRRDRNFWEDDEDEDLDGGGDENQVI